MTSYILLNDDAMIPYETSPKFSHDPTGQALAGRYTVRFWGPWEQSIVFGRAETEIMLIELS